MDYFKAGHIILRGNNMLGFIFALVLITIGTSIVPNNDTDRILTQEKHVVHNVAYMVYIEINPHDGDRKRIEACGGSLISRKHVLTAAHCVTGKKTINYMLLGSRSIAKIEPSGVKMKPSHINVHPKYEKAPSKNDMAVITLKTSVTLGHKIRLVKLPKYKTSKKYYVGKTAIASGWGLTETALGEKQSKTVKSVELKIISNAKCLKEDPGKSIRFRDLCTDGSENEGTCNGDSGGPLVLDGVQIGLITRGVTKSCDDEAPSVYLDVAPYVPWIKASMKSG